MERGTGTSHDPLVRLPSSLVRSIFDFVVDCHSSNLSSVLARVSHEWSVNARGMVHTNKLRTFSIKAVVERAQSTPEALRNVLTQRRVHLRELGFDLTDWPLYSQAEFQIILAAVPQLETLSIQSYFVMPSLRLVVDVLKVAGQLCPRVKKLTLVMTALSWGAHNATRDHELMTALQDALARWQHSGLRHVALSLPFLNMANPAVMATQCVDVLVRHGPTLERVLAANPLGRADRPQRGHAHRFVYVDDQWHIGLGTWETFCASCTQLTAFDWSVVPFATAFFEAFGKHPKPKLESLTLCAPCDWDWDAYHRAYPIAVLASGFGGTARNVGAVLAACPALRVLRVVFPGQSDHHNDDQDADARVNVVDDTFCATLATSCRQLEELALATDNAATFASLTDRSLGALATLPRLATVTFVAVDVTGDGLVALLVGANRPRGWSPQRTCAVTASDSKSWTLRFYEVATQLLTRLAMWHRGDATRTTPLSFASERVLLRLTNGNKDSEVGLSRAYLAALKELVRAVRREHASLRLRVVVQRPWVDAHGEKDDDSIVCELAVFTMSTVLPTADDTWTRDSDRVLDDVFVARAGGRSSASGIDVALHRTFAR